MRRQIPYMRTRLVHSGQLACILALAMVAIAAAPAPLRSDTRTLVEPVAPPVQAVAEPAGPVTRMIVFGQPVPGFEINSPYGMRRLGGEPGVRLHKGVDIAAPKGTAVLAAAEGRVLRIGHEPQGYGNFVELSHPNGMTSFYAHLSRIDVASGDILGPRSRLGLVGSTGYSTGPHLHFEVRRGGAQVNPARVIGRQFQIRIKPPSA